MTLPAKLSDLVTSIERTTTRIASESSDRQFLRLLKSGEWVYGPDDVEIEEGSKWAINPGSLSTGFAAWAPGELLGEEMALVTDAPIIKGNLEDLGEAWKPQIGFQLVCLDGEDEGTNVVYKTTSRGGQNAFKSLLDAILIRAKSGAADLVPVVSLEMDSYKHKTYGKVYTPIFKIVDWADSEGNTTKAVEAKDSTPEPEPAKEDEPPTRRRRRRAS